MNVGMGSSTLLTIRSFSLSIFLTFKVVLIASSKVTGLRDKISQIVEAKSMPWMNGNK